MKIARLFYRHKVIIAVLVTIYIWLFMVSGVTSAAAITVSGPSSVTESSAGGPATFNGAPAVMSDKVVLTITGDTYVNEEANSTVTVLASMSGPCGFLLGKSDEFANTVNGSRTMNLHTSNAPYSGQMWIYPTYDSNYTGTRTCTLTFSHNAAESANAEIVSAYGSTAIPSFKLSVLDAQPAPAASPTANSNSSPNASTPKPSSTTTADTSMNSAKPETPTVSLIDKEGMKITSSDKAQKITFFENEPIILSGKTIPNGKVKLYIFSEPQEASVTADENGDWTYVIENLETGNHRVEAEVTDPETGETSERAEVLAFTVSADTPTENFSATEIVIDEDGSLLTFALIGFVLIFLVTLLIISRGHPIKYIIHLVKH